MSQEINDKILLVKQKLQVNLFMIKLMKDSITNSLFYVYL